jgi:uncharacterized membrane protein
MISKWQWLLNQISHVLWLRASLFAVVGVFTALIGVAADNFLPPDMPELVGADSVGTVLNVLASSMLAVTTFSLGATVSAYSSVTNNVTPRATKLLMQDSATQTVLSTFIGSFLFSLVGIITLTIDGYGQRGRLVLFVVTVGIIVIVVMALLHWIDHLSRLGRVQETSSRVEDVATDAIKRRAAEPNLGGRPLPPDLPLDIDGLVVPATKTGYLQFVDTATIERAMGEGDDMAVVHVVPGAYVVAGDALATLSRNEEDAEKAEALVSAVRNAFSVGNERTFEQDPRFGLLVLAEVASRALSAAINDSGTAIDVISRLQRVLVRWVDERAASEEEVACPHVFVPSLSEADMFEDAFMTIARDGADKVEVQLRLQKTLADLSHRGEPAFRAAAERQRRLALEEAERSLRFDREKERVRDVAGA